MPSAATAPGSALPRRPVAAILTFLFITFLVLFPKGGVKLGEIPLTWGYLLFGLTLPFILVVRLLAFPFRFRVRTLATFASLLPFNILFFYSCRANGYSSLGLALSTFVSLLVIPFAFLIVYPAFLKGLDGERLSRLFRFSILAAALFGLFLFFLYPLTGKILEIPYLTVNADDYGMLEWTKHISRGYFLKLISTYNNGNVYGVATLILLPLYDKLEPRLWRRNTLKLALICTLSRTVWAGLVLEQLLSLLRVLLESAHTFPRVPLGATLRRGSVVLVTFFAILAGLFATSGTLGFLFDPQLGGRTAGVAASVQHITFVPSWPVGAFSEIIYSSALRDFGILGLLSLILIFAFPIVLFFSQPSIARSPFASPPSKASSSTWCSPARTAPSTSSLSWPSTGLPTWSSSKAGPATPPRLQQKWE